MQTILKKLNASALLVTDKHDIFHFTGFQASFAFLIVLKSKSYLFTDSRYQNPAQKLASEELTVIIAEDLPKQIQTIQVKHKIKTVVFQGSNLSYAKYRAFKRMFKSASFIADKSMISSQRAIKSATAIKKLAQAQAINELTLKSTLKHLKPGITEIQLRNIMLIEALKHGAEGFSFEPIIGFGKNSANIHHSPGKTKLKRDHLVLIDMGVQVDNYHSDMTRCFLPESASPLQIQTYETLLTAQSASIEAIQTGVTCKKLDDICRQVLKANPHAETFTHALGHGIGLEVHESPTISSKSPRKNQLEKNMVITIEPGIYIKNKFGIRIEDMLVVSDQGSKNLTNFPKAIKDSYWSA